MDTQQPQRYKVLLIGDSCTDVYVFGDCSRLSPEAPVPIFKKVRKDYRDGMSANVYKTLGNILPGDISYMTNEKSKIKKIRFVDAKSNHQLMRYDIENEITALKIDDLPQEIFDIIIISDYQKGFIDAAIPPMIRDRYDCPIFVDTKKPDLSPYKGCVVKVNEDEYSRAVGKENIDLIITLGAAGARHGQKIYPAAAVAVHDVCGAGDVFLAALAARWLETGDLDAAISSANRCAAHSVTMMGTYHLTRQEYEDLRV